MRARLRLCFMAKSAHGISMNFRGLKFDDRFARLDGNHIETNQFRNGRWRRFASDYGFSVLNHSRHDVDPAESPILISRLNGFPSPRGPSTVDSFVSPRSRT